MKKRYLFLPVVIACLLMFTLLLDGCSAGKRVSEELFYQVQEGETAVVHFQIDVTQGSIAFDIQEKEDASVHQYRGTVTESCEFDVIIDTPSWYRICVTSDDFHGTYAIDWKTE